MICIQQHLWRIKQRSKEWFIGGTVAFNAGVQSYKLLFCLDLEQWEVKLVDKIVVICFPISPLVKHPFLFWQLSHIDTFHFPVLHFFIWWWNEWWINCPYFSFWVCSAESYFKIINNTPDSFSKTFFSSFGIARVANECYESLGSEPTIYTLHPIVFCSRRFWRPQSFFRGGGLESEGRRL